MQKKHKNNELGYTNQDNQKKTKYNNDTDSEGNHKFLENQKKNRQNKPQFRKRSNQEGEGKQQNLRNSEPRVDYD